MSADHDSDGLYRKFVAGQSVALFKGILVAFSDFFCAYLTDFSHSGLMGVCSSFDYLTTPP